MATDWLMPGGVMALVCPESVADEYSDVRRHFITYYDIQQEQVEPFHGQMSDFRGQLDIAVAKLDDHYGELKGTARRRLGDLYNSEDYPLQLRGLFAIDWEFPSVEPPDYLLQLSPDLYEQERARVAGRFEEAVQMAEQAFIGELARLVSHLTERLTGADASEHKIFRDSAITNLVELFSLGVPSF